MSPFISCSRQRDEGRPPRKRTPEEEQSHTAGNARPSGGTPRKNKSSGKATGASWGKGAIGKSVKTTSSFTSSSTAVDPAGGGAVPDTSVMAPEAGSNFMGQELGFESGPISTSRAQPKSPPGRLGTKRGSSPKCSSPPGGAGACLQNDQDGAPARLGDGARASGGKMGGSIGNGGAANRRRTEKHGQDESQAVFSSRRERDRYRYCESSTDGGVDGEFNEEEEGMDAPGREDRVQRFADGTGGVADGGGGGGGGSGDGSGNGGGRQASRYGRPYGSGKRFGDDDSGEGGTGAGDKMAFGAGKGLSKKASRRTCTGSEEFAEPGAGTPLTPDKRLRAARFSPVG